jgi:DNA-binding transcriptional ArsR family regulator
MSQPVKPDDFDAIIHERVRLAIVAALAATPEMSFSELKAALAVTDGNLSAHARALEEAGYVAVRKTFRARKPHTALRLTRRGREAFLDYLEALRRIVDQGAHLGSSSTT